MKRSLAALAIALVVLGSFATAEGDAVLIRAPQGARYRIWDTKMGTLMLDGSTGHSWRLEYQEKSGYVWSQIPRAMMKDPGFPVDNPRK
jgi:hypothetical protein